MSGLRVGDRVYIKDRKHARAMSIGKVEAVTAAGVSGRFDGKKLHLFFEQVGKV